MIYITRIGNNLARVGHFGFSGENVVEESLLNQYKETMLVSDDFLQLLTSVESEIEKAEVFLK